MKTKLFIAVVLAAAFSCAAMAQTAVEAGGNVKVTSTPSGTSSTTVQGPDATGAAATGKPVQVGGLITGTGNLQPVNVSATGQVAVQQTAGTNALADGNSNSATLAVGVGSAQLNVPAYNFIFNGTTWDRMRGTTDGIYLGVNATAGDGVANTVAKPQANAAGGIYVNGLVFNGTTWDRLRGDTKGLEVHGTRNGFNCVVPVSTATTIQAVGGSCAAPGASLSLYITDIQFGTSAAAGTAADSFPTLKSGTGGTCGSATAVVWQALTTANSTVVVNLSAPIKVTANNELCWIMSTAGSKTLQIQGFIAP